MWIVKFLWLIKISEEIFPIVGFCFCHISQQYYCRLLSYTVITEAVHLPRVHLLSAQTIVHLTGISKFLNKKHWFIINVLPCLSELHAHNVFLRMTVCSLFTGTFIVLEKKKEKRIHSFVFIFFCTSEPSHRRSRSSLWHGTQETPCLWKPTYGTVLRKYSVDNCKMPASLGDSEE